jgi:hypothetical protein
MKMIHFTVYGTPVAQGDHGLALKEEEGPGLMILRNIKTLRSM